MPVSKHSADLWVSEIRGAELGREVQSRIDQGWKLDEISEILERAG